MNKPLHILLLEDSMDDAHLLERMLKKEGLDFACRTVENKKDFERELNEFQPDVVISDHTLPQFDSLAALDLFKGYKERQRPTAAFILVTGTVSEEFAVDIMKKGADDYILKDRLTRLPTAIISALEKNELNEQKRRVEEEKLHLVDLLEKSLHEIYVFNGKDFHFEYANEEALTNLGYTMSELKKLTPKELIRDFSDEIFDSMLAKVGKSKKGKIYDRHALRKDGSSYPIQIHLQVVEHGRTRKYLANVLDITDLKQQEKQKELALFIQSTFNENDRLDRSLEIILQELSRSYNTSGAEIFVRNFEQTALKRFAFWKSNEQASFGQMGWELTEKVLKRKTEVFCKDLQEELQQSPVTEGSGFRSAKAYPILFNKEILAVIVVYLEKQGNEEKYFFSLGEGVKDQLANNIKRKKTEIELAKIFDISPDVMVVVGVDGYVKKANPSLRKILGYTIEELQHLPIRDLVHPDDAYTLVEWQNAVLEKKEVSYHQNRYRTKDGDYKWFSWSSTPFLDEGLAFAVGKDITEEKKQVQAIERQNERLKEIAWDQSHLVRAPLTRMMGCIEHLKENDEPMEPLLENIKASAYELDDIIKGIVSKAEHIKEF